MCFLVAEVREDDTASRDHMISAIMKLRQSVIKCLHSNFSAQLLNRYGINIEKESSGEQIFLTRYWNAPTHRLQANVVMLEKFKCFVFSIAFLCNGYCNILPRCDLLHFKFPEMFIQRNVY